MLAKSPPFDIIRIAMKGRAILAASLISALSCASLLYAADTTPPSGSIKINNNASAVNYVNVTLNLSASDSASGVSQMQLSNDNISWAQPENYAALKPWALTSTAGTKRVYVKYKDAAGNWSGAYYDSIILDFTPPTGSIKINNDSPYAKSMSVTLNLSVADNSGGSGVSQAQFSNDNLNWPAAEYYSSVKSWSMALGEGQKKVYVKFKDRAGNWSAVYSDTIILDTLKPQVSITSPADGTVLTP